MERVYSYNPGARTGLTLAGNTIPARVTNRPALIFLGKKSQLKVKRNEWSKGFHIWYTDGSRQLL